MRVATLTVLVLFAVSCGSSSGGEDDASVTDAGAMDAGAQDAGSVDAGTSEDAGLPDAGSSDAGALDAGDVDAGFADAGGADAGTTDAGITDAGTADAGAPDAGPADAGTWKTSLHVCWTDVTCQRALALAHGGLWNTSSAPYDSNAALAAAVAADFDGVKIDVRVTSDDVPVISHSSPLELYESVDCYNRVIETSTAAQVTACHRFPSTSEKFQRLDDVINALRGKLVVQLCVKRAQDYQRTVDAIHALHAEDFAFIEVNASDMTTWVAQLTNAQDIFFLVNLASDTSQVTPLLQLNDARAFMFEFDPTVDVSSITPNQLHPAGVKSFTYDSSGLLSAMQAKSYFEHGFDAVSANVVAAQQARVQVNQARGVTPP